MCNHDHRTTPPGRRARARTQGHPGWPALGVLTSLAAGGYWLPALTGPLPVLQGASAALRAALAVEERTRSGQGYALTFDDGPHAQGTPAVLEALAAAGAPATFFLVGEQVRRHPRLVAEVLAGGHEVGIHCERHRNLLRLTPAQVRDDLTRAAAVIEELSNRPLALYRPPYGILNAAALRLARSRGWRTVLWSHWGRDWQARATPESICRLMVRKLGPGAVGLLHDADHYGATGSWRRTAAAVPLVLEELARAGLEPAAL